MDSNTQAGPTARFRTMALNWQRLMDGHSVEQLLAHYDLSERALVFCLDQGYKQVRHIRAALADAQQAAAMDSGIRQELLDLLAAHTPPAGEKLHLPTVLRKSKSPVLHKRQNKRGQWPGIPHAVWEQALHDPRTDVKLLMAHLSTRCRNGMARYLAPEYSVADLDKLIFSDLPFGNIQSIGMVSVLELDHWRLQLRSLRAAAQALAANLPSA